MCTTCSVLSTCCSHVWSTPSSTGPEPRKSGNTC
ncbi:Olfactory receptor [Apodemus speciosus]|uniref:Olfactory receptor n=1 Tax=Apodemus speciosus TaxID=105296 RepID=A0ABQ0EZG3_APOSI